MKPSHPSSSTPSQAGRRIRRSLLALAFATSLAAPVLAAPVTLPSGLVYESLKEGSGAGPAATAGFAAWGLVAQADKPAPTATAI